ncbi:MAG: hypothetical protein KatS3mg025_1804 [Bacteroidia bacterium]|nr:MAG: hypothetical protein KatS3mg025_1804 [Bacteroidia bacterium]
MIRLILVGLLWGVFLPAQCPYVRYILFDACPGGGNEGNDEHLIFWSGSGFNTDQLRIGFPNSATTVWCNSGCGTNTLSQCNTTLINSWNTTCGSTVFQCAGANTNIPANSWVILFTGYSNASPPPSPTNFCGLGTVYVLFANNTNTGGRYLNNPTNAENRATRVAFTSMPACSMTVNYRNITGSAAQDGNYLLIDPSVCIGKTEGQNNVTPSTSACYYAGSNGENGVSLGNSSNCALPPVSVLPILWAYVRVEGNWLTWQATGVGGDEEARLTLWYRPEEGGAWGQLAERLPLIGQYPLSLPGAYQLRAQLRGGGESYSPSVLYLPAGQPILYPNPAAGGPYLAYPEAVAQAEVYTLHGQLVKSLPAPLHRESLRGLAPGLYVVRLFLHEGALLSVRLWVTE